LDRPLAATAQMVSVCGAGPLPRWLPPNRPRRLRGRAPGHGYGYGYLVQAAEQEIRRRAMSSGAALMSMFGPMLEIGARVLLAIACGVFAVVELRISARAICQCDAGVFLVGWALGIVGVCGAWIGFASLALYRSSPMLQGVAMSGMGVWRFLRACERPIALAVGSGVLIALCLRRGRGVGATAGQAETEEHARGGLAQSEKRGLLRR